MNPVKSAKIASERKETAQGGEIRPSPVKSIVCPVCRTPRPLNRKWALYCSDRCRKAAYLIRKQGETPADIRATLNRIEAAIRSFRDLAARIAALEARVGREEGMKS